MIKDMLRSFFEMVFEYTKHRLFPVTIVIILLFSILVRRLFVLQIVEGQEHMDNFIYKSEKTLNIEPVRGNIYDSNGKLIAYNELSYSVVFSNDPNLASIAEEKGMGENELKNKIVYDTINILESYGDELYVDFPIELDEKGEYRFKIKDAQIKTMLKNVYAESDYEKLSDEQKNADANDIIEYLCSEDRFELSDKYSKEEKIKILSCRYKLWLNRFQQYVPVTIAYDISEESNAAITENADSLMGMEVKVKALRKYNDSKYFAHIIGYIGAISNEELEEYNENLDEDNQYNGDEMVGKTGIEQYCESELRGVSGKEVMYVDNLGKIIETVSTEPAKAGNDIYLTIDADLQKYCYDTLEKEIASILLNNISPVAYVEEGENMAIPITDVYFGLFDNNYLSIDKMASEDATDLEKGIYSDFTTKKQEVLDRIKNILLVDKTVLSNLSSEYQDYMEYICEALRSEGIFDTSLIDAENPEFISYTNNNSSLEQYLKYAISIEAIDISSFDADSAYYDNDEIYTLLCEYIINYLTEDTDFDKLVTKVMVKSGKIPAGNIIDLLYIQGVLNKENDVEYEQYKNGNYGSYEFMLKKIENLDITPAMLALAPCSGAIVVTDVKTGDVKAMVSYPSYDNNYLTNEINSEYYNKLMEDKTMPMYNRACLQKTAPGSTYKLLSSVCGLTEGVIDQGTYINCTGEFDKITPSPKCWAYPSSHGGLEVEGAIQKSCNVFYYQTGYSLCFKEDGTYSDSYGIERLAKYAEMFGLSQKSGVEVPETEPTVSDNDAVRSAIGQGKNLYAPIQLARYITTVANSGKCYDLTLIDKVCDYEGNLVYDNSAELVNTVEISQSTWNSVHSGMRKVITLNTPENMLVTKVNVAVAGKSGTAQESETKPDHALFVSYAPYDNPEYSVTSVIQNGYSSGNAIEVTGFIYAYMYDQEKLKTAEMSGNTKVSD